MPEGPPTAKPADEDAAHFLVPIVCKYPNEITLHAGGPMTNLALAISIDPEFPRLVKELVFMGASLNPQTTDPEFFNHPATNSTCGSFPMRRTSCCGRCGRRSCAPRWIYP